MKLLNNPIVVGILAVLALALVFMNVVWPMLRKAPQSAKQPAAPTPPLTTPFTSAMRATDQARDIASQFSNSTAAANAALAMASAAPSPSSVNIESATPRTNLMRWTGTPQRDPFQIRHLRKTASETNAYPPAMQLLTLGGIWRQPGGTLAVINKRVFNEGDTIHINRRLAGEGDTILRFTIKNIDADRVWVEGPNGREAVDFKVDLLDPPKVPEDAPPGAPKPDL
jgi:hypothetical protein